MGYVEDNARKLSSSKRILIVSRGSIEEEAKLYDTSALPSAQTAASRLSLVGRIEIPDASWLLSHRPITKCPRRSFSEYIHIYVQRERHGFIRRQNPQASCESVVLGSGPGTSFYLGLCLVVSLNFLDADTWSDLFATALYVPESKTPPHDKDDGLLRLLSVPDHRWSHILFTCDRKREADEWTELELRIRPSKTAIRLRGGYGQSTLWVYRI